MTNLEREIRKVAFNNGISLSDATRVVFCDWGNKMRDKVNIKDAYDFVIGDDARKEAR